MTKKTKPSDSNPDSGDVAKVIEAQLQALSHALAIVHSIGKLLHESYRFDHSEPDLGYCCDVLRTMLGEVIADLKALLQRLGAESAPEGMQLASALEARRQPLFRAQALAKLIGLRLQTQDFDEHKDPDLCLTFASVDQTLDRALSELEPLCLGLPIPVFGGQDDEASSES
jgi:hypothetical protein